MPTEAITCPQCGAADPSDADTHGVHRCVYCGARYRLKAGHAVVEPPRPAGPTGGNPAAGIAAFGAVLVLVAFGMAGAYIVNMDEEPAKSTGIDLDDLTTPRAGPGATAAPEAHAEVAAPPEKPKPTAEFALHHTATSSGDNFYVLGVITNTSSYPIGKPELHVILFDADGNEVGADNGYGEDDVVAPGGNTLISALVSDPPAHDHFETRLELREPMWTPTWAEGLEVAPIAPKETSYGGWEFAGKVTNTGDTPAQFVQVHISGWDADDKLVGLASSYAAGKEGLEPGGEARYKTSHSIWAGRPVRFEVDVVGRVP